MSMDKNKGVYIMSVASELTRMHPQTLRKYERAGLVNPTRVKTYRMYSQADIERLENIKRLVDDSGLNIAGLKMMLRMGKL